MKIHIHFGSLKTPYEITAFRPFQTNIVRNVFFVRFSIYVTPNFQTEKLGFCQRSFQKQIFLFDFRMRKKFPFSIHVK